MKYVTIFLVLSMIVLVKAEDKKQGSYKTVTKIEVYFPVDWRSIQPDKKPISRHVSLEGYLGFDGVGDFPTIILWESDEARKQQMTFRGLLIQSESASPLINKRFGAGVNSWKVLEGMFVSVEGILEIEPNETRHLFIGELKSIKSITVKNNGMALFEIK